MDADPAERLALEAVLHWYAAMGVDASMDEEPHDRFASPPVPAAEGDGPRLAVTPTMPASAPAPGPAIASASGPAEAQVRQAQALAAGAATLDELHALWSERSGCGLAATASRMVFAGGTPGARLMLVGAAPEADDERQGEAFAGRHGRLLDAMLAAIGFDRTSAYLANVVPWRPPGGRAPTPLELALCLPFVRRQIELAAPRVVLCLGERAAQPLIGTRDPIGKLRGRWLAYEGEARAVPALVTYSLDFLLKQPSQKKRAWTDLQALALRLEETAGAPERSAGATV